MTDNAAIRTALRAARLDRGWSFTDLGRRIDTAPVAVRSWESGERNPPMHKVHVWAGGLDFRVVLLGPKDLVVSGATRSGQDWLSFVVVYGPNADGVIDCDSLEEALSIQECIPGARIGQRLNHTGAIEPWPGAPGEVPHV